MQVTCKGVYLDKTELFVSLFTKHHKTINFQRGKVKGEWRLEGNAFGWGLRGTKRKGKPMEPLSAF